MSQTTARVILVVLITALLTAGCFVHTSQAFLGLTILTPVILVCLAISYGVAALCGAIVYLIIVALDGK